MSPASLCTSSLFNPNFTFNQNPHTKAGSLLISNIKVYSFSKQKFNLGFCNLRKRVSEERFSLRNGGELLKVKCVELKSSENGKDNHNIDNNDVYYMRKALDLARTAIGCTSPNPMVGCVIVKDGKIVGQGFHPKAGQPHAEVFALRDAGELAENATAYVTLEPCNHYGRTPPCSEALIKAKVKKVVIGMVDPNPIVLSRGIDRLREAGIEVIVGVEEESCKELNEAFIHKMLYGKPFVALRYSITINGASSDQLGGNATKCGGYYSRLLQEYDAVVHAPNLMTQNISFYQSQEPNACQPVHIVIVKDSKSLSHILKFLAEGDFKSILFADTELLLDPLMSQMAIETMIQNQITMDAILDYCSRQGFCNVLFDLRGKHDDLEEILGAGIATNLIQKALVEVLPVWAGSEVSSSSVQVNQPERKRLKNISTKYQGDNILLEAYF